MPVRFPLPEGEGEGEGDSGHQPDWIPAFAGMTEGGPQPLDSGLGVRGALN